MSSEIRLTLTREHLLWPPPTLNFFVPKGEEQNWVTGRTFYSEPHQADYIIDKVTESLDAHGHHRDEVWAKRLQSVSEEES